MISTLFWTFGWSILFLSLSMIFPSLISFAYSEIDVALSFIISLSLGMFSGVALILAAQGNKYNFNTKVIIVITIFIWPILGVFSSLPFLFSETLTNFSDAFFESISGITSSGSSVIINISETSKGIIFWRSFLQWIGGFLTILLAISVLSLMRIGGINLFHSSFQKSDRDTAVHRFIQASKSLWWIYIVLTIFCGVALSVFGMKPFDALIHSLSTISTGGFSSREGGINEFSSIAIELVICLFMLLGALNFTLYWAIANGKWNDIFSEGEFRYLIVIIIFFLFIVFIVSFGFLGFFSTEILRFSLFNIISSITTTGYHLNYYGEQFSFSIFYILFILLMLIGGASVSTSGGIKILRLIVFFKLTFSELFKLSHPNAVFPINYMNKSIDENSLRSAWGFLMTFISVFVITTLFFSICGLGFIDSFSLSALSLTNTGAGTNLLFLSKSYFEMNIFLKWIIIFSQLIGKIEIILLMIFFSPNFWRN